MSECLRHPVTVSLGSEHRIAQSTGSDDDMTCVVVRTCLCTQTRDMPVLHKDLFDPLFAEQTDSQSR
ncbi:hypothetical protein D1872_264750 [compost metagenome]